MGDTIQPSTVKYAVRIRKLDTVAVSGGRVAIAGEPLGWGLGRAPLRV